MTTNEKIYLASSRLGIHFVIDLKYYTNMSKNNFICVRRFYKKNKLKTRKTHFSDFTDRKH